MASTVRGKRAIAGTVPGDLQDVVLEAIRQTQVLKASKIRSALPKPYQRFQTEARRALDGIVERGEAWARTKGKSVVFFARDPIRTLDELLLSRLPPTFDQPALVGLLDELAPDYDVVLTEWLRGALERRVLFEHAPAAPKSRGAKKKRFGREPDVNGIVAPLVDAIRKLLPKADALGVPRRRILEAVMAELGPAGEDASVAARRAANGGAERDGFVSALSALAAENPRQALLSVRDLRSRLAMSKDRFDALALQLSRDGVISLHLHDLPSSLTPFEREQYVRDERGNYYIGVAPRRG